MTSMLLQNGADPNFRLDEDSFDPEGATIWQVVLKALLVTSSKYYTHPQRESLEDLVKLMLQYGANTDLSILRASMTFQHRLVYGTDRTALADILSRELGKIEQDQSSVISLGEFDIGLPRDVPDGSEPTGPSDQRPSETQIWYEDYYARYAGVPKSEYRIKNNQLPNYSSAIVLMNMVPIILLL
jgi:hypothetical protein